MNLAPRYYISSLKYKFISAGFTVLMMLCSVKGYSQNQNLPLYGQGLIDSVLRQLPKVKEDTNRVNLLNKLSFECKNVNADTGLKYGLQGLALAEKLQWKKGIAIAENYLGFNAMYLSDFAKADDYYLKALKIDNEIGNKNEAASVTGNIGLLYMYKAELTKALEYDFQALKMYEGTGDKNGMATIDNYIGSVYADMADYPRSLEYYFKALKLSEEAGNKNDMAPINGNIGSVYKRLGQYAKAVEFMTRALKIGEEIGNKKVMAVVTAAIGNVYSDQGNYAKALEYTLKALKLLEGSGDTRRIASIINDIGNIYGDESDYPKALEYYFRALKTEQETGNKAEVANTTGNIGNIYRAQGDLPKALEYFFKALKDKQKMGDKDGVANTSSSISAAYTDMHKNVQAIVYARQALQMSQETGNKKTTALALLAIGEAYISLAEDTSHHKPDLTDMPADAYKLIQGGRQAWMHNAITALQAGLDTAEKIKALAIKKDGYYFLAKAYELSGKYHEALKYHKAFTAIQDSLFSKENEKKLVQSAMQFDYDKQHLADSLKTADKEKDQRQRFQRQRSYTYIGAAGALILLAFSFFTLRNNKLLGKEKKRSEDLLLNILPAEVAEELKDTGVSAARYYEQVTVLFTDFVNFTGTSEKMTPQTLIAELNVCFKAFDEIITKYNIEKIKTIGDAYLAVAGLPVADALHAENMVRAAIEIAAFMAARYAQLDSATFQVRIGIHSGSVVAGIVGIKKFAYDIWGDTVNTAARMEQYSEPGKINISQATYELVKDKFNCVYRGEIEAKNKGEMKMYFIT